MFEPFVIFFDNHLLVLYKPPGLLTQPTNEEMESLESWGKEWVKNYFQKPGNVFLHAIHRLDKGASGVVLFARTSKALSRLQKASREGSFKKTYFALVEGNLREREGECIDWLIHEEHRARRVSEAHKAGKKSHLKYRVLKEENPYTLLEVSLKTGRYHQIRVQLSARGCPIAGDQKYGSRLLLSTPQAIALHHGHLHATHPISGKDMDWHAPLPSFWPVHLPSYYCDSQNHSPIDPKDSPCLPHLAARSLSDDDDQCARD